MYVTDSIKVFYYFKNHWLYKSIDFKLGEKPHAYYWNQNIVKKHSKKNIHPLTDRDMRLMKIAMEFNEK